MEATPRYHQSLELEPASALTHHVVLLVHTALLAKLGRLYQKKATVLVATLRHLGAPTTMKLASSMPVQVISWLAYVSPIQSQQSLRQKISLLVVNGVGVETNS